MKNESELKDSVKKVFMKLAAYYRNLFISNDKSQIENQIELWFSEIKASDITASDLNNSFEKTISDSRFTKNPPNIREFISLVKGQGEKSRLEKMNNYLIQKYRGLWKATSNTEDQINYLKSEMKIHDVSEESIVKAVTTLIKKPVFFNFPPSMMDILSCAKLIQAERTDIPLPCDVVDVIIKGGDLHPLLRYARNQYGEYELKSLSRSDLDKKFKNKYIECLFLYMNGEVDISFYENKVNNKKEINYNAVMDSESLVSLIDDIKKNYN